MATTAELNRSLWLATSETAQRFGMLENDLEVDVVVVGAGITGLTTALRLQREGLRVAVLERDLVATGTTGSTTAKVTALHGLIYRFIDHAFDVETARVYAEANRAGVELVAEFARECDFRRLPTYTYTTTAEDVVRIEQEVHSAQRAGLPATLETGSDLPFEIAAAVKLDDQIHLHPRRYCAGLADEIVAVYEHTEAIDVEEGSPCVVRTRNAQVRAAHVVIATQLPFVDRGLFFAKAVPDRSYCVAGRVDDPPHGMYLSSDQPLRSIRPHFSDDATWLIVGGEGHKVGHDDHPQKHYEALEAFARDRFGMQTELRWSAQDYMPADGLPYIGRIASDSERVFVATGFQKWGLSTGTFAAIILSDLIAGRDNPWHRVFDSTRIDLARSAKALVKENADVAKRFIGDHVKERHPRSVDDLAPGDGDVVREEGHAVAAYRDEDGVLHLLSPKCTHLGCLVRFNQAEKSWDCPCHGSRFSVDGRVLEGPAVEDLAPVGSDTGPRRAD